MRNSLVLRVSLLSVAWIFLALLATAWILWLHYQDHSEQSHDFHVQTHLEALVHATIVDADGRVMLAAMPTDPNFRRAWSGWYWELRQGGETLAASPSLGAERLDIGGRRPGAEIGSFDVPGPNLQPLRVQAVQLSPTGSSAPVTYLASAPAVHLTEDLHHYARHILVAFALLGVGLTAAVLIQVRVALTPVKAVSESITALRDGRQERLEGSFPDEIQPLVDALNGLLEHNEFLLRRAREQVGDLAHALKNPITVLRNEARDLPEAKRASVLEETETMAAEVEHYLARARTSGRNNVLGELTPVPDVLEDLEFAMKRIHGDDRLLWRCGCEGGCVFRGDREDLETMIGNLLDNAGKWARRRITVRCDSDAGRMKLTIEDDGPGIPAERREEAMRRGTRLDAQAPGHGLGLAIVRDLARLYGGTLKLGESAAGGLRAELELPGTPR